MKNPATLGRYLIVIAIVGFAATVTISAALAPPIEDESSATEVGNEILIGVHGDGEVVLRNESGDTVWSLAENSGYFDVTRLENGSVAVATAIEGATDCGPYSAPCTRTGVQIINASPEPHVVWEWTFPVPEIMNNEVHDVEVLSNNEFLVVDMMHERLMHVVPGEGVVWQWNASSYYDAPESPTQVDWLHMNDVDRIAEGRYLLSVRNENQLLIIDREEGVVDVVNENGSTEVMKWQHNPQWLGDGHILVSDSENNRVVELAKNNTTGEWEPVWVLQEAGGLKFDWPRDADRLPNGNTLITDSRNNRVVEVTSNGTVVWSVKTANWPYEADRLPHGEQAGELPHSEPLNAEFSQSTSSDFPGISHLYAGVSYVVTLPHWYKELQLSLTIVQLLFFVGGAALIGREWIRK